MLPPVLPLGEVWHPHNGPMQVLACVCMYVRMYVCTVCIIRMYVRIQ